MLTEPFKIGFSNGMDLVFLVGASVLAVAFFLALALKEVPLRTTAGIQTEAAPAVPSTDTAATSTTAAAATTADTGADVTRADQPVGPEGGRHEGVDEGRAVHVEDLVATLDGGAHTAHGTHEATDVPESAESR